MNRRQVGRYERRQEGSCEQEEGGQVGVNRRQEGRCEQEADRQVGLHPQLLGS